MDPPAMLPSDDALVMAIERPHPRLFWQFMIYAACSLAGAIVLVPLLYFRYKTLRYRFDAQGVSIAYGILFRREAYLTYARIQDIHVTRSVVERWLGLGTVEIETAAGTGAGREAIAGLEHFERVRDFLYAHMRGALPAGATSPAANGSGVGSGASEALLREIRDALRDARDALRVRTP